MTTDTLTRPAKVANAGMSQIVFLAAPEQARSVVGSCIALTLYHRHTGLGALGHIVLPKSEGRGGPPGKFVDTAIPYMIQTLGEEGAASSGLVAKICGGAAMFGPKGAMQIGANNIEAITELLAEERISIGGVHFGGEKGRRVTFDCETGKVTIDVAGKPSTIL
jgi:chemotaxis protein CheD